LNVISSPGTNEFIFTQAIKHGIVLILGRDVLSQGF
jgi:hypothetical protein